MRYITVLAASLILWTPALAQEIAVTTPTVTTPKVEIPIASWQVVESLNAALLDVMRNADKLGFNGRYEQLAQKLGKIYDFADMARIVSGRNWKSFTPEQQAKLADAYMRMSVSVYAMRLIGFSGENFEILGGDVIPPPSSGVMVRSRLVKNNGEEIKLDYRLHSTDNGWRIVDVFYNGSISELASQRSQYVTILKTEGYDGLMKTLEQKVANLAAGKEE